MTAFHTVHDLLSLIPPYLPLSERRMTLPRLSKAYRKAVNIHTPQDQIERLQQFPKFIQNIGVLIFSIPRMNFISQWHRFQMCRVNTQDHIDLLDIESIMIAMKQSICLIYLEIPGSKKKQWGIALRTYQRDASDRFLEFWTENYRQVWRDGSDFIHTGSCPKGDYIQRLIQKQPCGHLSITANPEEGQRGYWPYRSNVILKK